MHIAVDGYSSTDYVGESMAFSLELTRLTARDSLHQITLEAQLILEHVMDVDIVMEASPNEKKANSKLRNAGSAGAKVVTAPVKGAAAVGKTTGKMASTGAKVAGAPIAAASMASKATKGAVNAGKNAVAKVKSFFKKIIEFIRNMFTRFKDNMQTIFQNSTKWLLEREKEFGDIDYTDLSTDLVPYWDGKESGSVSLVTQDLRRDGIGFFKNVKQMSGGKEGSISNLAVFQEHYMSKYMLDGDLREGLLNYYRVGNVNGKDRVTMKGDQIYKRISGTIIPYIKSYETNLNTVQKELNYVDGSLTRIMNGMNERNIVVESYSELFRTDMANTEFALHDEFLDIVGENTRDSADNDRTKAGVNTSVRDNRTKSEKDDDASKSQLDEQVSEGSESQVKVLYNYATTQQLALSCFITAMDERYTAYINLLKSIWKAGNVRGGRDPGGSKRKKEEVENNQ